MRKLSLWMMAAILTCGPMLTSCVDSTEDNPSGGSSESGNIIEPSVFADLMYPNVYAGDNFYEYAVGRWLDQNPLKPGQYNNGTMAAQVDVYENFLKALSGKDYGVKTGTDEVITALNDDYSAKEYADDKALLMAKIDKIDKAATKDALYEQMGLLVKEGYQMPFEYVCMPVERRVTPVLEFPDKIKHLSASDKDLIEFANMTAEEAAKTMKEAEEWKKFLVDKKLSNKDNSDNRQREMRLKKVNLRSGTRAAGKAPLLAILKAAGIDTSGNLLAGEKFESLGNYLDLSTLEQLKMLCKYLLVNRDYEFIPSDPNNKQRVWEVNNVLTALFKYTFSPISVNASAVFNQSIPAANREAAVKMAEEIRASFKERINNRQWLSAATKTKAIEKLEAMTFNIGWPANDSGRKNWLVKVPKDRKSLYQDILDLFCQRTALVDQMKGKEGDADLFYAQEWFDQSYKPNARYMEVNNSMYILGINLIEPIFDLQMCDALKYSVIGATTIGHEITHGFDNEGSLYNKIGKKEEWWTPADKQNFAKLQDAMVKNFNSLYYADNVYCDGKATLPENIADLGGLYICYDAFVKKMKASGISGDELDRQGREYFRGFAYGWMENMSENAIEDYKKDEHSANLLRVNGNVYLMDEFYRLFNIKDGKMYLAPKDRIEIW